jgi:hypothetical protein
MGISLLMDTLRIVMPTFIIQLESSNFYRNYAPLTTEYVSKTPGLRYRETRHHNDASCFSYEHFVIPSPTNLAQE